MARGHIVTLISIRFGSVVIIERGPNDNLGHTTWVGQCDCGKVRTFARSNLKYLKSCGRDCVYFKSDNISTHCGKGHEFTPENSYVDKRGRRSCKMCRVRNNQKRDKDKKNRLKQRQASQRWAAKQKQANPNFRRDQHLRSTYGISNDEYQQMMTSQNGLCFICSKPPENGRLLNVDHCHATNKLRKLLCWKCNSGLGLFTDNPELLIKAAEYLKEFQ